MTIEATFKNGAKAITVSISGSNKWAAEEKARVYFDLEFDKAREPILKFYEVISGGTRDKTVTVGGRVFGYELTGCDSNAKRREAFDAVESLAAQIVEAA